VGRADCPGRRGAASRLRIAGAQRSSNSQLRFRSSAAHSSRRIAIRMSSW
jgi:hypothetical protein